MAVAWLGGAALVGVACSLSAGSRPRSRESAPAAVAQAPAHESSALTLPAAPGALSPARVAVDGVFTDGALRDVEACETCHPAVARQWRSSAHALSSFSNPIYRASVDRFRDTNGDAASKFCAGCHDPALLVDGKMETAIVADDPSAHAGVSCRTCHSMTHATVDGNASYSLTAAAVPIPEPDDPASVTRHRARVARAALGTAEMCGSCHRAFLGPQTGHPHHLAGTDDLGPWMRSGYAAGSIRIDEGVREADCAQCHMPRESGVGDKAADAGGTVASHRFVGGHTWLAAMTGDDEQLAQTRRFLEGVVSVDVAGVRRGSGDWVMAESAAVAGGDVLELDVVLRNRSVAHRFPGGTRDAQQTWVEVRVFDADGALVADTERGEAHQLRAYVADDAGEPLLAREVERFRGPLVDHTIAPRDAVVVRHGLTLPKDVALPVTVEATLRHQSRTDELRGATCTGAGSDEGRAFAAATATWLGVDVDPCVAQPVTTIDQVRVTLGSGVAPSDRPTWQRRYEHGLGLSHDLQERAEVARQVLLAARASLPGDATDRQRAMVTAALSDVAIRQGRFEAALSLAAEVEATLPDHVAGPMLRGRTLAAAWRWQEAAS
ncbi:MAG: multiheme c-type cytochrome, partial [Myxococcota bacterium]